MLVYFSPVKCERLCKNNLYNIRQVTTAMGKNRNRVNRLIITYRADSEDKSLRKILAKQFQGTAYAWVERQNLKDFLAKLPNKSLALKQGYLYLVDPNGNVILAYQPSADPKGLFEDLKHLLKVSQIG